MKNATKGKCDAIQPTRLSQPRDNDAAIRRT